MNRGYVYILTNDHMPGLVKVGRTTANPKIRARQLSSTGVPGEFIVKESEFSKDCKKLESMLHNLFQPTRVNSQREFFKFDADLAALILRVYAGCGSAVL